MITLTHANFNVPVIIGPTHIAAAYWSENNKCTHLILVGAIVPVKETVEQIVTMVNKNRPTAEKVV
jgi:hypothetical protein